MYQLQTRTDLPRKLPCPYSPCFKLSLFICLQIVETKNPRAPGSTETRQMLAALGKATCCGAQAKLVELKPASHPLRLSKAHSHVPSAHPVSFMGRRGTHCPLPPTPSRCLRPSLSASSLQLRCISYSCSRLSGSEAVRCCSSSDCIHAWYLAKRAGRWPRVLQGPACALSCLEKLAWRSQQLGSICKPLAGCETGTSDLLGHVAKFVHPAALCEVPRHELEVFKSSDPAAPRVRISARLLSIQPHRATDSLTNTATFVQSRQLPGAALYKAH